MNLQEYIREYKIKIDKEIENFFTEKINSADDFFVKNYYSELKDYILAGGKRIRPLLCIATYNAFSKNNDDKIILPSLAVEFLHNASLIHDDIIDKDDFRRGNPAFHYRFKQYHERKKLKKMTPRDFGTSIGILGGDTTFFFGLEPLIQCKFDLDLKLKSINYYEKVFQELCEGVLIEMNMVNEDNINIEDYIKMVSLKTGALIEKSMLIGACFAKTEKKYLGLISDYAINLGIAFQIIDDILGTFGDEKITGKPTDGDIREGKKTALLIHAINSLDDKKRIQLISLLKKDCLTEDDVIKVRELFTIVNAKEKSEKLALNYYDKAMNSLKKLEDIINREEFEFLKDLLTFTVKRKK